MKHILCLALLSGTFLFACRTQNNDPRAAAREYCQCMHKYHSSTDFAYALTVCRGRMVEKYRLYKIDKLDMRFRDTAEKIPDATADSVKTFMSGFNQYLNENCGEDKTD
jgi:hypothetical protein